MRDTCLLNGLFVKSGRNEKKSEEGVRPPLQILGSSLPDYFSESLNSGRNRFCQIFVALLRVKKTIWQSHANVSSISSVSGWGKADSSRERKSIPLLKEDFWYRCLA